MLPLLPASQLTYECPGHRGRISEAVHRARMEADFPACRGCVHGRTDRQPVLEFDAGSLRGRAGNVIDASSVAAWGRSLAAGLVGGDGRRPRVVIGRDGRSAAAELAAGLRAMATAGCELLDLGRTRRPVLDFAVRELAAEAGVMVTGGRRPAGWTGLDVVGHGGAAWSWPGTAAEQMTGPLDRPMRQGGGLTSVDAGDAYVASFLAQTHTLRPLRLLLFADDPTLRSAAKVVFENTPVRADVRPAPSADPRQLSRWLAPHMADGGRFQRDNRFDVAAAVDRDGRRVTYCDGSGQPVPDEVTARVLSGLLGATTIVLDEPTEELEDVVLRLSGTAVGIAEGRPLAICEGGSVRRDALLSVAMILRQLTRSGRSLESFCT